MKTTHGLKHTGEGSFRKRKLFNCFLGLVLQDVMFIYKTNTRLDTAQWGECLPSIHRVLGSIPNNA